jgi:FHA domain
MACTSSASLDPDLLSKQAKMQKVSAWDVEDPGVWQYENGTCNRGALRLYYSTSLNDYSGPAALYFSRQAVIKRWPLETHMSPKLIAIAGPLRGKTLPLAEDGPFSIGRDLANQLCLSAANISRWHCRIERDGARLVLRDLGSANGTFVNGASVMERVLAEGDCIAIGEFEFLLLLHDEDSPPASELVKLSESELRLGATLSLRREEARYLQPSAAASPI